MVSGTARVGTRADGEVQLAPGSVAEAPAGEDHWHGAAPGVDTEHLCFTWGATQLMPDPTVTA